jgi:hypothetical protein
MLRLVSRVCAVAVSAALFGLPAATSRWEKGAERGAAAHAAQGGEVERRADVGAAAYDALAPVSPRRAKRR